MVPPYSASDCFFAFIVLGYLPKHGVEASLNCLFSSRVVPVSSSYSTDIEDYAVYFMRPTYVRLSSYILTSCFCYQSGNEIYCDTIHNKITNTSRDDHKVFLFEK